MIRSPSITSDPGIAQGLEQQGGPRSAALEEGNPALNIDFGRDVPSLPLDLPIQAEATMIDG